MHFLQCYKSPGSRSYEKKRFTDKTGNKAREIVRNRAMNKLLRAPARKSTREPNQTFTLQQLGQPLVSASAHVGYLLNHDRYRPLYIHSAAQSPCPAQVLLHQTKLLSRVRHLRAVFSLVHLGDGGGRGWRV